MMVNVSKLFNKVNTRTFTNSSSSHKFWFGDYLWNWPAARDHHHQHHHRTADVRGWHHGCFLTTCPLFCDQNLWTSWEVSGLGSKLTLFFSFQRAARSSKWRDNCFESVPIKHSSSSTTRREIERVDSELSVSSKLYYYQSRCAISPLSPHLRIANNSSVLYKICSFPLKYVAPKNAKQNLLLFVDTLATFLCNHHHCEKMPFSAQVS